MRVVLVASCGLALLGGCSSTTTASSDPFVGTYDCSGSFTLTFTTPAGAKPVSGNTAFTNVVVDDGGGKYTSTTTNDAGVACTLEHTVSGNTGTLVAGQTCTFGNLTYSYTSGSSSLSGTTITSSSQWSFAGTVQPDGGSPVQVAGTGTGNNTCNKQ